MAKRKEVILQEILNTPQLWEDAMTKENLYVVDVHQKWCGPCKAIIGMLKRIKNEMGDDHLKFATAEADSIPALESYRGKCEPMFLFYGHGQLVGYVRGCNAPLLQETIVETLKLEHKVLEGQAERKVIKDIHEPEEVENEEDKESEEEGEVVVRKQITVALIKPDVVANGQVDEIIEKINLAGIEVLANEEKVMTEDEAKAFYQNKADEEYFDDLISYVVSGPCRVLVLTKSGSGEGVVEQWRDIIGPFDAAVAKEENPDSLRAIYGTDAKANALHGSSSQEEAARELGFFFPDFEPPTYRAASAAPSARSKASARSRKSSRGRKQLQRTLAIIRPDALKKHKDAIMEKIKEAGFEISMLKEMQLTEEQAKAFYKDHEDKDYFEGLVQQMTSGPVLALCLAHSDAISKWRDMLGPKIVEEAIEQQPDSLRAQFHVEEAPVNMLHGSDSIETAEDELKNIFNVQQTLAVIKPDAMDKRDAIMEKLKEAGFMISCQKDMNLSKEIANEIYKSKEGAEFYDGLIDHMTSGPTLMMVLSAEDAVTKLRNMMGPADPDQAKETAPESLRALFAKSIMENAIHSPSTQESASERIKFIFGDMEFNWDAPEPTEETAEKEETADQPDKEDAENKPEGETETKPAEEAPNPAEATEETAEPAGDAEPTDDNTGEEGDDGESGLDSDRKDSSSPQPSIKEGDKADAPTSENTAEEKNDQSDVPATNNDETETPKSGRESRADSEIGAAAADPQALICQ
uniref:thioredoxin domain-containing protein 3 homolog isoform X3 n=1 Tax=Styela clava TaxID=7725 RepID=UPI00193A52E0|nr:thioredoxin domain-containing protein 3 homolog isoform X3 [Styela clava]